MTSFRHIPLHDTRERRLDPSTHLLEDACKENLRWKRYGAIACLVSATFTLGALVALIWWAWS